MKKSNILLIGAVPQPTGGISIHVKRFIEHVSSNEYYNIKCYDLKKKSLFSGNGRVGGFFSGVRFFFSSHVVHIHVSNSFVKCFFAFISKLFLKKVVYTHHNSLVSNGLVFGLMFLFSDQVVLVNDKDIPEKFLRNKCYRVIPAFIPPFRNEILGDDILHKIKGFDCVVSTNCFSGSFLNDGHLYGFDLILEAVSYISENKMLSGFLFVLVDPGENVSMMVRNYLDSHPEIEGHVLYIGYPVDFSSLINVSDVTVRATQTDGDSISVRESLYFNVPVIASDVCCRPKGTIIFQNRDYVSLAENILNAAQNRRHDIPTQKSYVDELLQVYRMVICS